ncbi:excinuclease ABC subunit UvrA [Candidatus Similichlamydia laticola]|nr:excinuclease ABC subunit UvrA [Candidatus Similichlamydia laticola]
MPSFIRIKNARTNTLKGIDLELPKNHFIVFCGPSGSGKSSMAYETLFPKGQISYIHAISPQAKQLIQMPDTAVCDSIEGLTPAIATSQRTHWQHQRSTVGTLTELSHYLQVLFMHAAVPHCPLSGKPLEQQDPAQIIDQIQTILSSGDQNYVLCAPYTKKRSNLKEELTLSAKKGFHYIRLNGKVTSVFYPPPLKANHFNQLDLCVDRFRPGHFFSKERLVESTMKALEIGQGVCILCSEDSKKEHIFSLAFYSKTTHESFPKLHAQHFSFNSIHGMCERCQGLGFVQDWNLDAVLDPSQSIKNHCCLLAHSCSSFPSEAIYRALEREVGLHLDQPWFSLSQEAKEAFLYGHPSLKVVFEHPIHKKRWEETIVWEGVFTQAWNRYQPTKKSKSKWASFLTEQTCPSCLGSRLKEYPRAARLNNKTFLEINQMSVSELIEFFSKEIWKGPLQIFLQDISEQVQQRLHFLSGIGLDYLTLGQSARSLSGGELQRCRLAGQVGSGLSGMTYIFDEPSIGLHPQDIHKLIYGFHRLRDHKNTVIVVEHDETTILSADHVVEFGPEGGEKGGTIVFQGSPLELLNKQSATGKFLQTDSLRTTRRTPKEWIVLEKVSKRNIFSLDLRLPLGVLVAFAGVSGSGKSTLVHDILIPEMKLFFKGVPCKLKQTDLSAVEQVVVIDQEPIGRIARSNPATYIKVFDEIRNFFSSLPESLSLGFEPGRFSFNVKEGSCSVCHGLGYTELPLDQGAFEAITCTYCKGLGFDEQTLSITFKRKNIADVLNMTVDEAAHFFSAFPKIYKPLEILQQICLGYLKLGQPAPKLSGGEAQRIKLARELTKRTYKKKLYILDEPTTGLHPKDITALLKVLNQLVDQGHTVLVIEHNTHVLKQTDWIIELGEGGGKKGGKIIVQGTPEQIQASGSPTGEALRQKVQPSPKAVSEEEQKIILTGVSQNGLQIPWISLNHQTMIACYGPSGSGKHSFAVQTVYAEGQRHYVESLAPYLRQSIEKYTKPSLKGSCGLLPAVHVSRRNKIVNPRSTIGTNTQIYDFLRVLYARIGTPYCPLTRKQISFVIPENIILEMDTLPQGTRIEILAPLKSSCTNRVMTRLKQLFQEGFSQIILDGERTEMSYPLLDKLENKNHDIQLVIDRLKIGDTSKKRWLNAIERATEITKNILVIRVEEQKILTFYLGFCVPETGKMYPKISPKTFSFNHPDGQCPHCKGLGVKEELVLDNPFSKPHLSVRLWLQSHIGIHSALNPLLEQMCKEGNIEWEQLICSLNDKQKQWLWQGGQSYSLDKEKDIHIRWNGVRALFLEKLEKRKKSTKRKQGKQTTCLACHGSRLAPLGSHVLLEGIPIHELCSRPIVEIGHFLSKLNLDSISDSKLPKLIKKIIFLINLLTRIGVGYLPLHRCFHAMSLGERQRICLAEQIGNDLTNILYVLEEPSLGLHQDDCRLLLPLLLELKSTENTLLMIEQHPEILEKVDTILQFDQTKKGNTILAVDHPSKILSKKDKEQFILSSPLFEQWTEVELQEEKRFRKSNVKIPIRHLTVVVGKSGAGKSLLLNELLSHFKSRDEAAILPPILVSENPLSFGPRSNLLSTIKLGEHLRHIFSHTSQAKAFGLTPAHFNPNSRLGMCPSCSGVGQLDLSFKFLPNASISCSTCQGMGLNPLSLEIEYKEKKYKDLFSLSLREVLFFFQEDSQLLSLCQQLDSLGLSHLLLGQEIRNLSKGELQRLKLFLYLSDLSEPSILLLDDPLQSLHPSNRTAVLRFFAALLEKGHTLICATCHEELINQAHWTIHVEASADGEVSSLSVKTN